MWAGLIPPSTIPPLKMTDGILTKSFKWFLIYLSLPTPEKWFLGGAPNVAGLAGLYVFYPKTFKDIPLIGGLR